MISTCLYIHSGYLTGTVSICKLSLSANALPDTDTAECIYNKRWAQRGTSAAAKQLAQSNIASDVPGVNRKALSDVDDAKLIFGSVFSLRRIVKQLGGDDDR